MESESESLNQKRRTLQSSENSTCSVILLTISMFAIKWKLKAVRVASQEAELNQSQSVGTCMHCDWFIFLLLLLTPTIWFYYIVSDSVIISGVRWKWNLSRFLRLQFYYAYDWLLRTLIFDFHWVTSAFTTPLMTATLLLVQTSLKYH